MKRLLLSNNMMCNLKNKFLYFSLTSLISSIIFFTAYNWKSMSSYQKLSIPIFLVLSGTFGWFGFKKQIYKDLSLLFSSFMIGVLFAVFGQVYQTGADVYSLFLNWGIFTFLLGVASGFYPIWFLNITVFSIAVSLYTNLYYNFIKSCSYTSFFILMVIFAYLFGIKIKKFHINKVFFYFLSVGYIVLITNSVIFDLSFLEKENILNDIYYILSLGVFTYICERKINRTGILPLSIISLSFFIQNKIGINYIISILISLGTIVALLNLPKRSESLEKVVKFLVIILKFNLVLMIIFFVADILYFLGLENHTIGLGGVILIGLSQYFPKFLKFKKDKTEIVTFTAGLILLGLYLNVEYAVNYFLVFLLGTVIFDIFFKYRHSKSMDYIFILVHSILIISFLMKYSQLRLDKIFIGIFIFLIILLGVLTFNEEKIKNIKTITRGLEISVIVGAILNRVGLMIGLWKFESIHIYIGISSILVSIILLLLNRNKLNKIYTSTIIITLLGVGYFCANLPNISVMLMLIILYIFREERYYEVLSCILLIFEVSQYYYLTHITLIEKSISLAEVGGLLIVGYLFLNRFLEKEVKNYEE